MTDSSTVNLEREAEQKRADMVDTAEQLRAKLTPGQLLDEVAHTFRGGDWGRIGANLKSQVRDNPLALALVGVGIACMAAGVPGTASRHHTSATGRQGRGAGEMASSAAHEMRDAADGARRGLAAAGSALGDHVSSSMEAVSGLADETEHRTRDAIRRVEDQVSDILHREPLVLGALGLAIGGALGALLPESQFEKEHLGPYEDRLREASAEAAGSALRKAENVAAAAGQAAMDEADRQGFVTNEEASQLSERVGRAADNALGKAEDKLSGKGDSRQTKSS